MLPHFLNSRDHSQCCAIFPDLSTQRSHGLNNTFKWIHYASWQVASTSASSTESKNRSTSCSSRPLQLKSLKHYERSFLTEVESNNHRQSTTHGSIIPFLSRLSATRKTRNTTSKWIRRANLGTDSISGTPRRWNRVRSVSDSIQH